MDTQEAIEIIDDLYPTDCQYEETNAIGEKLLNQAKQEVQLGINNWRDEDEKVLIRYAELCLQYHDNETRERMKGG